MPEIITKYPEIVIKLLRDLGARCGEGVQQRILTACPPERFCSTPTGEFCVYGLNEVSQMTQITPAEITCKAAQSGISIEALVGAIVIALAVGIFAGLAFRSISHRKK